MSFRTPIYNKINENFVSTSNPENFFSDEAIVDEIKRYESINVVKYNKIMNFNNVTSLLELLDTKEQLLKIDNFLENQNYLTSDLYTYLVNIYIEDIFDKYQFPDIILFVTISIFNKYISLTDNIKREDLKLIFITSFYLACKNEHTIIPAKSDLIFFSKRSLKEIFKTEIDILSKLNYDLNIPNIHNFISFYTINKNQKIFDIAKKLLLNVDYINLLPSLIAASLIYRLSGSWDENKVKLTKYNIKDLF